MTIWVNNDGLRVKFKGDEAVKGQGGTYEDASMGGASVTELTFDFTDIASTASVIDDHVIIPSGVRIEKIDLLVHTAFTSGGAATLNMGLVKLDRTTNAAGTADVSLINAGALATINGIGKFVIYTAGSTGAGDAVGTLLSNAAIPTIKYGTAAYTAGKATVRIVWAPVPTING